MRKAKFYLGRIIKLGVLDQDKLIQALLHSVIIKDINHSWTITDCIQNEVFGTQYIFGNLSKFHVDGHVTTVNVEESSQQDQPAPNLLEAAASFVYFPECSGIAYMHVWNGIQEDVFRRRITKLVETKYNSFFVGCTIEAISDYNEFSKKLRSIKRFTEISATVKPPNPLFGSIWKELKEYIIERNSAEIKIKETERNDKGINSQIHNLITSILSNPDYSPPKPAAMSDAAILMAADGYGRAKAIGFDKDSKVTIRTTDTQKFFLIDKQPKHDELAKIAYDHFRNISSERRMKH